MIAALVARLLSTSALAGTRGSLVLFAVALAARFELLDAPQPWMTSNLGLGLLLALVVLEELAEQDEDLQALFDTFAYVLRGGAGALAAASVGASASEAGVPLPQWGAALLGAGVATGTHHLRARLHQQLQGAGDHLLSPRTWLAWLELGGVLGLLVAVVFAPAVALGFVVLATVGGVLATLGKRAVEDRLWRRECPSCRFRARVEARRCPGCKQALQVQTWLG
ncbi:MAG: DUF4126 family protein [Enhygromyxa sp.]